MILLDLTLDFLALLSLVTLASREVLKFLSTFISLTIS